MPADRRKGSSERLLRAAVYAFCSLPRPSRREIAQLDDLAIPLVEKASSESRRYIAAALSECRDAPSGLVRRLCDEPVETAAPLLMKSRELCDIDLIALIGRHGLGHARAIARRKELNPRIAQLITALEALDTASSSVKPEMPDTVEATRQELRAMMVPAAEQSRSAPRPAPPIARWQVAPGQMEKLRATALTGVVSLFQQALANALGVAPAQARALTAEYGRDDFLVALRALDLREEEAFLLAACVFGRHYAHPEAIRLFLDRYRNVTPEMARSVVREWKYAAIADAVAGTYGDDDAAGPPAAANQDGTAASGLLKVS